VTLPGDREGKQVAVLQLAIDMLVLVGVLVAGQSRGGVR